MNKRSKHSRHEKPDPSWHGPPVAVLWDQSLVWGLICRQTLLQLKVPFHLLSADEIARGYLSRYHILLIPGGWAAHKVRVLGRAGRERIREFIEQGGSYLGFCGGAGMALSSPPSLGLVPLERMRLSERLPNASGQMIVRGISHHPAWRSLPEEIPVSIWWPSQFAWQPLPRLLCVGTYVAPGKDFWVADLPYQDLINHCGRLAEYEKIYGINLDPARLLGHPAIIEIRKGKGFLILSYPHLETPGDHWANRLFFNFLAYLDARAAEHLEAESPPEIPGNGAYLPPGAKSVAILQNINDLVEELIHFGERHLFWQWHLPWLLRWQRGIRGLEYGMLAVAVAFLQKEAERLSREDQAADLWAAPITKLEKDVAAFCREAKNLLVEEKLASLQKPLNKLGSVNEKVDQLRALLFGNRMNHGGLCRSIFDDLDRLLLQILRLQPQPQRSG